MVKVRFLINDKANFETSETSKDWVETDKDGNITGINWGTMLSQCGYFEATLPCYSNKQHSVSNSDNGTTSTGGIYYWYNDDSLIFDDLYDAKSSGSSGSSNNKFDNNEIRTQYLPLIKSHIVSIVIWSTSALDTLECIDDNAFNDLAHLSSVHFLVPVTYLGDGLFNPEVSNRPGRWLRTVNFYGGVQFFENECFCNAGTDNSSINFIKPASVVESGSSRVYIRRPTGPTNKTDDSNWSSDYGKDSSTTPHWYDHPGIDNTVNYVTNQYPIYIGQSAFKNCKMKLNFLTIDSTSDVWAGEASSYGAVASLPAASELTSALGGSTGTAISNTDGLPQENQTHINQFQRGLMALSNKACYFGFHDNTPGGIANYIQENKGYQAFYQCAGLDDAYIPVQLNMGNQVSTGNVYSNECEQLFAKTSIKGVKIYPNPAVGDKVTITIPPLCFLKCEALSSLKLFHTEDIDISYIIRNHAFKLCKELQIPAQLLENAQYIYHWAFEDVGTIGTDSASIINFNKLSKIGQGAFAGISKQGIINCSGFSFPVLTHIGEGILYNTDFSADVNTSNTQLLFTKDLTTIRGSENTEFADYASWEECSDKPFGGATALLNKIRIYQISGHNLTFYGGNQYGSNAFIPKADELLTSITQLVVVSESIKNDFDYYAIPGDITLPNTIQTLNLHAPIQINQSQLSTASVSNIWFNSWKTFRNTVIIDGWPENANASRQLAVADVSFNDLTEFNINTVYSDFIEGFNDQSLENAWHYSCVNYQIFYNTKHTIEKVVLYDGDNDSLRDLLLPGCINGIQWPIQELIIKKNLPYCSAKGQTFNTIYRPLDVTKPFIIDYSANTEYSELKQEHFFHSLTWPGGSDYEDVYINLVLNDNISIINGYSIFNGSFRIQDTAHRSVNDGKNYYSFPSLKRIYNPGSATSYVFKSTFAGVVYNNSGAYGARQYWSSDATNTPSILLSYQLPTSGNIDLGNNSVIPNLQVIQDGALKLPASGFGSNSFSLILPWTGTSIRQTTANEGSQIKTIFATKSEIVLPQLTLKDINNNSIISTDSFPLLSGFTNIDTLVLDGVNGNINGALITKNETLIINNLTVKQGAYNDFFKWCESNVQFKTKDSTQEKIQLIFETGDDTKKIKIPNEFFSNKITVDDYCDLVLGTSVTNIGYQWRRFVFQDKIDICWYKGSYSDWGINLELANSYCNPIAAARELQLGSDGKTNNHHITEWDFTNAINPITDQNTIRQYTYTADPFLNSVNLSGVEVIQDGAFLGAKAIREFYSSNTDEPVAIFFNKGLNKTIWQSYVNTAITSGTLRQAASDSKTEGGV